MYNHLLYFLIFFFSANTLAEKFSGPQFETPWPKGLQIKACCRLTVTVCVLGSVTSISE